MSNPDKIKKSKSKIIIIALAIIFVLALLGYRIVGNFQKPEVEADAPVNVKVTQAELTSIYATSPISGRVTPIEENTVYPMSSGEVTRVNVKMGDYVKKGAVLCEIDRTQMAATYNQAKEGYNAAKSAFDRLAALYKEGAVSLQNYEQAETQYKIAGESLTAASEALSYCTVTSPIDGYITAVHAVQGGIAAPGAPVATVANTSALEINTAVSEYLIAKLKEGDPVKIHIASLGDTVFEGKIKALSPAPAQGGLTYPITVSVEDSSGSVMAGMFAEVEIISDEKDKVLCIPSDAVIVKSGKSIVVTLDGENIPQFKEVATGIDNGEYVEITSGLSQGETVVTLGQQFVKEGVAVKITE